MGNDSMMMNGACKSYPKFFKVYLPDLSSEKLMIPTKFVKKFGDDLSDVATLTLADGRVWRLGLIKAENTISFHDGWHEFVEYYSILIGYFLVFSYKGTSNFHVSIFDTTSCEIDCLFSGPSCEHEPNHNKEYVAIDEGEKPGGGCIKIFGLTETSKERVSDKRFRKQALKKRFNPSLNQDCYPISDSIGSLRNRNCDELRSKRCKIEDQVEMEYLGNTNETKQDKLNGKTKDRDSCRHAKKNAETVQMNRNKIKGTYCYGNADGSFNDDEHTKTANGVSSSIKQELFLRSGEDLPIILSQHHDRQYKKTSDDGKKAIRAAKRLRPENPSFLFIVTRRAFHNSRMCIPCEFARKYLRRNLEHVTVRNSDGREWSFQTKREVCDMNLTKGWPQFSRDNNLKVEDVCVFELIKTDDIVLKVSIFHA